MDKFLEISVEDMFNHVGHNITVATYGGKNESGMFEIRNISLECEDCNEVIADMDLENYNNLSEEKIKEGFENWDLDESLKGYGIFTSDFVDGATHIERIDEMEIFESDYEASLQAEKDGIKIIKDLPKNWEFSDVAFIDTKENREKIKKYLNKEKVDNKMKNEYTIPVEWQVYGIVKVKANSLEEAVGMIKQDRDENGEPFTLPTDSQYVDGSFNITDGLTLQDIYEFFNK